MSDVGFIYAVQSGDLVKIGHFPQIGYRCSVRAPFWERNRMSACQYPSCSAPPNAHLNALASNSDMANLTTIRRSPDPSDSGSTVCHPAKCTVPAMAFTVNPSTCREVTIKGSVRGNPCLAIVDSALKYWSKLKCSPGRPIGFHPVFIVARRDHFHPDLCPNCGIEHCLTIKLSSPFVKLAEFFNNGAFEVNSVRINTANGSA